MYGTLRTGFGNHWLLAGRIDRRADGVVDGYEMVVGGGIPFARPAPGGRLVVELIRPVPALYDRVLADADRLEGYDPRGDRRENLYLRTVVTVDTGQDEPVRAWLYEIGPRAEALLGADSPIIATGDYADAVPGWSV